MTIEQKVLLGLDEASQNLAISYHEHNQRIAGEENLPKTLHNFQYMKGFKFQDTDGRRWTIDRFLKDKLVIVTSARFNKSPLVEIWGKNKIVKLPDV